MTKITEYDAITKTEITRDLTNAEIAQFELDNAEEQAAAEAQKQDDTAKAAARQNAIAKLTSLGLTAGEAAALFGEP